LSSLRHLRRRPAPVNTSSRRTGSAIALWSVSILSPTVKTRPQTRRSGHHPEGDRGTPLTSKRNVVADQKSLRSPLPLRAYALDGIGSHAWSIIYASDSAGISRRVEFGLALRAILFPEVSKDFFALSRQRHRLLASASEHHEQGRGIAGERICDRRDVGRAGRVERRTFAGKHWLTEIWISGD
jgi:hypothetical protein